MASSAVVKLSVLFLIICLFPPPSYAQNSPNNTNEGNYPYARFSPSMAIIIVVLIAALFLMGFFSIYIRNCAQGSSPSVRLGGAAGRSRRNAARGLDVETIASFPTMVYSEVKGLKIGKGALECAVCLNEFEDDETLRLIPKCDHVFHPDCIDAWLTSHTTCPVCRANLAPQPGDPVGQPVSFSQSQEPDIEAQNEAVSEPELNTTVETATVDAAEPEVVGVGKTLNRNRTRGRGSRSGRPPKFPRSHSTGHSLVQPGENTDRFTLRLPAEVRKQIMERELSRSSSMVLPRGGSSRRGYRTGEGSSRGKYFRRPETLDRVARSERWSFTRMPSFLRRAPSATSPSIKSPKVAAIDVGQSSSKRLGESVGESSRPPV